MNTIDWNIFNLGIDLKDLNISPKCPADVKQIGLTGLKVGFRGPSFSPIGLKLKTTIELNKAQDLEAFLSLGPKNFKATIDSQSISLSLLKSTSNLPVDISGNLMMKIGRAHV